MRREPELLEPVLEIWREVLQCGSAALTADSNFFLSGGDSLDLVRVLVRVRERFGAELDIRDAAQFSTPRKMAQGCAVARGSGLPCVLESALTGQPLAGARYPSSAGQAAMWLAEQRSGISGLYNTAVLVNLSGQLQVRALAGALAALLAQHEVLRSRLQFDTRRQGLFALPGSGEEVVLEPVKLPFASARQGLAELAARPFDLAAGPLWRFQLAETGPQKWTLLFCLHHCISDGWSGSVLLRHLAEAYNTLLLDPLWCPSECEHEFRAFCLGLRPAGSADLHWWGNYLESADRLPSWPPTVDRRWPFKMLCEEDVFPEEMMAKVQAATRAVAVNLSAFFLAALRLALALLAGIYELCIGLPVNVRRTSAQEGGVGYFVNLLVARGRISPQMDCCAVLRQEQENLDELLRHRHTCFAELAQYLRPALLPSGNPWCDVLYVFQNLPLERPSFAGLDVDLEHLTMPQGQHPLKVEFVRAGAAYRCRIEYACEVLSQADARELLATIRHQVIGLATAAARRC